jgi:short-chain fatty acids transporter
MRDSLTRFARISGVFIPDATAMAVFMLLALGGCALLLGNTLTETTDAFYRGLWMLLPFSMQMTLILLLSGVLASTPGFRRVVFALAAVPRNTTQVFALSILLGAALSYLYWGLAFALGPLIAVHFARAAERRGIAVDFPCLLAAQFAASSVWQYGLSSTAMLLVATPGHFLEKTTGVMPLSTTIWSTGALAVVVLFPCALIVLARLLMPRQVEPLSAFPNAEALTRLDPQASAPPSDARGIARWSERTRLVPLALVVMLIGWLWHHFVTKEQSLDFNSMIVFLLIGALLMQGNIANFSRGLAESIKSTWQIAVLYQIYGAVAGLLQFTNVGAEFAGFFASLSTPTTFAVLSATAGTVVAVFVPSSGGQWIIQGFVTSEAAAQVGVSPQIGLLSLSVGDQMGNLITPFWMILVAGVARVDFRKIYGFCLVFAALWFALGATIFTIAAP